MQSGGVKTNLATFMKDKIQKDIASQSGPFITISRQYGCPGYFLGLLLVDMLNGEVDQASKWKVYQREILEKLSNETDLATDTINKMRREKPGLLTNFFRNLTNSKRVGAYEIRNRIADIIRSLCHQGNCIMVGMGGAGATSDMENGLRIRLEAPVDWRVKRVVESEGVTPVEARLMLQKHDAERDHLRKIYGMRFSREPAFDLVYDCSSFSLAQITQHMIQALKLKKMI